MVYCVQVHTLLVNNLIRMYIFQQKISFKNMLLLLSHNLLINFFFFRLLYWITLFLCLLSLGSSITVHFVFWVFSNFLLLLMRWRLWYAVGYTLQNKQLMEYLRWNFFSVCLKKLVLRIRTITSLWMMQIN